MISIEYLRERLVYNPVTGRLMWRYHDAMPKKWNARWAENEAFATKHNEGYRQGKIDGTTYLAHRVAFAVYYGHWPVDMIDHINGDKADNRIANLREATNSENQSNRPKPKNNTSGFKGVTRNSSGWVAQIKLNSKLHYLGTFKSPEQASKVYIDAAAKMHGDFARLDV